MTAAYLTAPRQIVLALGFSLALAPTPVFTQDFYEWIDEHGKKHFSQTPPSHSEYRAKTINTPKKTGVKFADQHDLQRYKESSNTHSQTKKEDGACIKFRRRLHKIEAGLERIKVDSEIERAKELKKVIMERCGDDYLNESAGRKSEARRSAHCYEKKLDLLEVLEATGGKDGPASEELRSYIVKECGAKYLP